MALGANEETFGRIAAGTLAGTETHELVWGPVPDPTSCPTDGHEHVWSRATDGVTGWWRDNRCDCVMPIAGTRVADPAPLEEPATPALVSVTENPQ
jgi:hypothetical protein